MARKPPKVASEHGVRVMASGELNIFYHSIAVVRIVDVVLLFWMICTGETK